MIKNAIIIIAATLALTSNTGCKDLQPNAPLEEDMKDSIGKVIPGVRYIGINIQEHQDVTVTLGSKSLYNSSEQKQQEYVELLAKMTVHFFEENNYLDDGKVIFVPNETTLPTDSDPKKEYDMNLEQLLEQGK